jgi:hypothetical protein
MRLFAGVSFLLLVPHGDARAQDADGDGLSDVLEATYGTDPALPDTDGDTVPDGSEVLRYASNPLAPAPMCLDWDARPVQAPVLNPAGIFPADMDGDGDLDALWGSHTAGLVEWAANLGGGVFAAVPSSSVAQEAPFLLDVGDLDTDGDPDALVGTYLFGDAGEGEQVVWIANDAGVLRAPTVLVAGIDDLGAVAVIDVDTDGDDDALVADEGENRVIVLENVAGVLQPPRELLQVRGPHKLHADDFDLDGDLDLMVAHADGVDWYSDDGTGTFVLSETILFYAIGYTISSIDTLDADQDGDRDALIALGYYYSVDVYDNLGSGVFGPAQNVTTDAAYPRATPGDLDNDGREDIVVADGNCLCPGNPNKILWFRDEGVGWGPIQILVDDPALVTPTWPHTVDMDLDGDLDLFTSFQTANTVGWWANPTADDRDVDGVSRLAEVCIASTDDDNADTDGGTMPDGEELLLVRDPRDPSDDVDALPDTGGPAEDTAAPGGPGPDDEEPADTEDGGAGPAEAGAEADSKGCGCESAGAGVRWWLAAALALGVRRRR